MQTRIARRDHHRYDSGVQNGFDVDLARNEPVPLAKAACALCQGHCCRGGGDEAFLDVTAVARTRASMADHPVRTLLRAYLQHLPAHSVQDSCVYHGASGCELPRTWRADLCNRYRCIGLNELLARPAPQRPVLIAAVDDHTLLRTTVVGDVPAQQRTNK